MSLGYGNLIVFEGVDGVGKTTLAQALAHYLQTVQIPSEYRSFPGRELGTLGFHIYDLHHNLKKYDVLEVNPLSLQMLHVAAHIDEISERIRPALHQGTSIILDRFWWSTLVYGRAAGVKERQLRNILRAELEEWKSIQPRISFLITRKASLRIETDEQVRTKWTSLNAMYKRLAEDEQKKYPVVVIENEGSFEGALAQVLAALEAVGGIAPTTEHQALQADAENSPLQLSFTLQEASETSSFRLFRHSNISPAKPSEVFDTYWQFAAERQEVFFRRYEGHFFPWTADPILQQHKFTNAYRASDRVSQYLIRKVIYEGDQSADEVFFRTLLFKFFNRIESWERLLHHFGHISFEDYSFESYDAVLTEAIERGEKLFSAAYIMPSGSSSYGYTRKHRNYLRLLEQLMKDDAPKRIANMRRMRDGFEFLRSYPTMGDFLAYQFIIDINYSELTDFSEMEFVIPGPGARDGIRKCFISLGGLNEADIIRVMAERQQEEFERLGIKFRTLWGRPLQLIDCQNLFCEVDKYARVAHPGVSGVSGRTRIKQKYQQRLNEIDYWYPPKWGINDRIQGSIE